MLIDSRGCDGSACITDADFVSWTMLVSFSINLQSVGRALDCRVEGRGFDSLGRTNSRGLGE